MNRLPPKPPEETGIEAMLEIMESPCRHLESCVEWADDSGKKWSGSLIRSDPRKPTHEKGEQPVANPLQERIERALAWCRKNRKPARIIVLKGRRSGSSLICAKVVDLECRNRPTKALVMADVFKRSDEIFDFISQFSKSDVFPWRFAATATARTLVYENGSECIKETALDPNAGRGGGFRVLWFSECAHFPSDGVRDANKLMLATLNTVPKTADSVVIVESTANGQSGWYYDRWLKARWLETETYWQKYEQMEGEMDDDEAWVRVFAAWYEIPRNTRPVTDDERKRIMATLSKAEKEGVKRYGWKAEQIAWRRWTVRNDFNGNEAKFDQEYPSDPKSAFVASGSPAFSRECLNTLRQWASRAQWRHGVLDCSGVSVDAVLAGMEMDAPVTFRQTPAEEAWLAILETPQADASYVTGCDPASGADVTDGEGDLDNTSVVVLRAGDTTEQPDGNMVTRRPRMVARLMWEVMQHHPPERVFLYILALLQRFYGNPTLVVETNKGEWVVIGAKKAGLNLYQQQILTHVDNKVTQQLGFTTTQETRHNVITRLQSLVHGQETTMSDGSREWQPAIEIECLHVVGEMETFVRDPKGKFSAAPGRHDDDVLAVGMAAYLIEGATRYRTRKRKRRNDRW